MCSFSGVNCEQLTQPAFQVQLKIPLEQDVGGSHRLTCTTSGFVFRGSVWVWFRQAPGKGLEWISLVHISSPPIHYSDSVRGRFTISRDDSSSKVFLRMNNVRTEDSVVYYCARETQ
uniref:Immunoglobulin heavy variable 6-2 n=1 Tax=Nothobranchius furzeri TaxID=105023 RepID=A0A8C6LGY9_NOTFU